MTDDRDDDKKSPDDRREPRLPSASGREDPRPIKRGDSAAPPLRPSAAMRTYMRPAKLQPRLDQEAEKTADTPEQKHRVEKPQGERLTADKPSRDEAPSPRVQRMSEPRAANDSQTGPTAPPPPLPPSVAGAEPHRPKPTMRADPPSTTKEQAAVQRNIRKPEAQQPSVTRTTASPPVPSAATRTPDQPSPLTEPKEPTKPPVPPADPPAAAEATPLEPKRKKPGLAARLFGRGRKLKAERLKAEAPSGEAKPVAENPVRTTLPPSDTNVEALPARPVKVKPQPRLVLENVGLEIRSLGKHFKKRPVLRDVSLRVQRGEAVGLLGPNGAGKTTCFYIVTGLIPADYGEIFLDGQDITSLPMYRRARMGIGYLPQEASIFRGLTVEQNIRAVLELVEKDLERRETALESLLAEFSISHLRRTPAIALSGGERRRLEIARALASQPNFILLDEPLAGIDPIAVRDIRDLVSHLKDRGIGVLITDHNVRETLEIVDRAYILHDGNVLMEGPPAEIVANQEVRRVYLGDRFTL